jgi:uncharacterized protein
VLIPRPRALARIKQVLSANPVAALLGPRQCGKTTLAREVASARPAVVFDLEDPVDKRRLSAPMLALEALHGLVIIDEAQRMPELFEIIRVLVDRPTNTTQFLLLGSAAPQLTKGASESLAGRIGFIDLAGFELDDVGGDALNTLWMRGGFPRAFLAPDDHASDAWRQSFIRTFLERDVPQLGINFPAETMRRFWTMVAHYHGQVWNGAELARSLGASEPMARRYLDVLVGAHVVRVLPPWFENVGKRQVKSPKIYVRDSGLLHSLLSLITLDDVRAHPKLGASWEGFAIEHIIRSLDTRDAYFWGTHGGSELDLMVSMRGKRYGFEIKYSDAPRTERSMHVALADLGLDHLWVIYPGREPYALETQITAMPLRAFEPLVLPRMSQP